MTADEIVKQWRIAPFKRGSTDCCAFADFVVAALTGEHYLPRYSSDAEAEAIMARHGGLSGAVTYSMGRQPVCADELAPGDVAYIQAGKLEAVGVVLSKKRVATVAEDGMTHVLPLRVVVHGWKLWA